MPQFHLFPRIVFLVVLVSGLAHSSLLPADTPSSDWEIISHFPHIGDGSNTERRVLATDGSRFFCYGGSEVVSYSDDGFIWKTMTTATSHLTVDLVEVIYENSTFVGVDTSERVFYSTDGFHWQSVTVDNPATPETESYHDVTYNYVEGEEQFLIVGNNGATATTTGNDPAGPWTPYQIADEPNLRFAVFGDLPLEEDLHGNITGGPTYVAAGARAAGNYPAVYYRDHTLTWAESEELRDKYRNEYTADELQITGICFNPTNGESESGFYIGATDNVHDSNETVAGTFLSRNGSNWDNFCNIDVYDSIHEALSGSVFVDHTDNEVFLQVLYKFSPSAGYWTLECFSVDRPMRFGTEEFGSIAVIHDAPPKFYDIVFQTNKTFVLAGNDIDLAVDKESMQLSNRHQFRDFYYFPNLAVGPFFLLKDFGSIFVSENAYEWSPHTAKYSSDSSPPLEPIGSFFLHPYQAAIWSGDRGGDDSIFRSANLVDWEQKSLPRDTLYGLISGASYKNMFIAGSSISNPDSSRSGIVFSTVDGESWDSAEFPYVIGFGSERSLQPAEDGFVFLNRRGIDPYYSADGLSWKALSECPEETAEAIAYGNHRFLYVAEDKSYVYHRDSDTWSVGDLPFSFGGWLEMGYFTHGRFFLIAGFNIWSSIDGVDWEPVAQKPPGFEDYRPPRPQLVYDGARIFVHFAPVTIAALDYTIDRLDDWKTLHNVTGHLETSDNDGDGLSLLEEYGRGHDPNKPDRSPDEVQVAFVEEDVGGDLSTLAAGQLDTESQRFMTITFDRRTDDPQLQFEVQEIADFDDPDGWQAGGVQVGHPLSMGPGMERVTYRATLPLSINPNSYMRVKITRNAPPEL